MEPNDLNQAVSQGGNNIQGALQQMLLSRIHTPEQMQERDQNRQSALGQYQSALREEPYGDYTPTQHGLYTWIGGMGQGNAQAALARGIGAGGEMMADINAKRRANEVEASKVGYGDAAAQAKLDMGELGVLKSMAGGRAGAGTARPIKLADGTWGKWDPITQTVTPLAESAAAAIQGDYDTYYKMGEKILATTDPEVLNDYALSQIEKKAALRAGSPTKAVQDSSGALTPFNQTGEKVAEPAKVDELSVARKPSADVPEIDKNLQQILKPEDLATAQRLIARINSNPASAANDTKTLENLLAKYIGDGATLKTSDVTSRPSSKFVMKDAAEEAGRKVAEEEKARIASARAKGIESAAGTALGDREAAAPQAKTALIDNLTNAQNTVEQLDKLISHPGLSKSAGLEGTIPGRGRIMTLPGSDSANFQAKLDAAKSQIGLFAMAAMKQVSATGSSGMGAMTESEHRLLQNSIDSISLAQDDKELKAALKNVRDFIANKQKLATEGFERLYPNDKPAASPAKEDDKEARYQAWKKAKESKGI